MASLLVWLLVLATDVLGVSMLVFGVRVVKN